MRKTNKLRLITPKRTLDDLLLPEELLETFLRLGKEREFREKLAQNGLKPRNRILFHGPPGNGKTASAEAIANLLDLRLLIADYAQLIDSLHGGSEKAVVEAFDAIDNTECVVLFDEADSILSTRVTAQQACDRANNNATNLLLTRLDELEPGVVFIAATNRVDDLDRAAARRFDLKVHFSNPSSEQKRVFAAQVIKRYPVLKRPKVDINKFVAASDADNFAELEKEIIDLARCRILGD